MKKPKPQEIAAVDPLTKSPARQVDPILNCNICGLESAKLRAWREHDERDKPIGGTGALVFIGGDHPSCIKAMDKHPRLYSEVRGMPGHFPALCGSCPSRTGLTCSHPDLKANGGPGLHVTLSGYGADVIICRTGHGCHKMPTRATFCAGRKTLRSLP